MKRLIDNIRFYISLFYALWSYVYLWSNMKDPIFYKCLSITFMIFNLWLLLSLKKDIVLNDLQETLIKGGDVDLGEITIGGKKEDT